MRSLGGLGASRGEGVGTAGSLCLDLSVRVCVCLRVSVCEGLEELWQGSRHCPVCTNPIVSTPPAQTECCRGRGGLAGSWGTLPPLLQQEHQPWEPLWQGSPQHWHVGAPQKSGCKPPLPPSPPPSCLPNHHHPSHPNVRLGAWEGLQVHGQTSY